MNSLSRIRVFSKKWGDVARMLAALIAIAVAIKSAFLPSISVKIDPSMILTEVRWSSLEIADSNTVSAMLSFNKKLSCVLQNVNDVAAQWEQDGRKYGARVEGVSHVLPSTVYQDVYWDFPIPPRINRDRRAVVRVVLHYLCRDGVIHAYKLPDLEVTHLPAARNATNK